MAAEGSGFARSHAIVVGIDAYRDGITPLLNARRDALAIAEALAGPHGYEVESLLDGEATSAALTEAFGPRLAARVSDDDRVLVYFAGHGVARDGDDGPEGFLVAADARSDGSVGLLPMLWLHDSLSALRCRHLLLVLDCCFAGSFRWAATRSFRPPPRTLYRKRYERFIGQPAWQVLTSTAPDQKALDLIDGLTIGQRALGREHSPFAAALLDGLAGGADRPDAGGEPDGVITATELYQHIRDVVELSAEAQRKEQTPGLWPLKKHGRGEFLFHVPGRRPSLTPDPPLDPSTNPWRGLKPYGRDDAALFFGRGAVVRGLRARLTEAVSLVAVLGASGTGKSSVVRAGLLPSLGPDWVVVGPVRPQEDPAAALDVLEQGLAQVVTHQRALLVLDQLEEIFTLCRSPEARADAFARLDALAAALEGRGCLLVTARSDFLPQLRASALGPRLEGGTFTVPPMSPDELREVIEAPALARAIFFEPDTLIDRLINEVVAMPGALPLLSFTLSELYHQMLRAGRDDRALREVDYAALGGVVGSLRSRAQALFDAASESEQRVIARIFVRFASLEGGELARRRVTLRELWFADSVDTNAARDVLDHFTDARLLQRSGALGETLTGEPDGALSWVEPAHDTLVLAWDRVHLWLDRMGSELHLQRALWQQACEWDRQRGGHDGSGALWDEDPRLPLAVTILERPDGWLNALEAAFVRASADKRDADARRRRRVTQAFVAVLLIGLVGVSFFAWRAVQEGDAARVERDRALQLNRLSGAQMSGDPTSSIVLLRQIPDPAEFSTWSLIAQRRLDEPVAGQVLQGHEGVIRGVRFDPSDPNRVTTFGEDGTARRWTLDGEPDQSGSNRLDPAQLLPGHDGPIVDADIDGARQLLTCGMDGTARVWATDGTGRVAGAMVGPFTACAWLPDGGFVGTGSGGELLRWPPVGAAPVQLFRHPDAHALRALAVFPDATAVLVAGDGGFAAIVPLSCPEKQGATCIRRLEPSRRPDVDWGAASVSPDGLGIALAGERGEAALWGLDGRWLASLTSGNEATQRGAVYSPDGTQVLTWGDDHRARLFTADGRRLHELIGHQGAVTAAAFAPDGTQVFTASLDNLVFGWSPVTGAVLTRFAGHASGVTALAMHPSGARFVTGSGDWTGRVWSTSNPTRATRLSTDRAGDVLAAAFDPSCHWLLTGDATGRRSLFQAPFGQSSPTVTQHEGAVRALAFSPDGAWYAVGNEDGDVEVFACATRAPEGWCVVWAAPTVLHAAGAGEQVDDLGHSDAIVAVAFAERSSLLVTASEDESALVWSLGPGPPEPLHRLTGHREHLTSADVDRTGNLVATGAEDGDVLLYDLRRGSDPIAQWTPGRGRVMRVRFDPTGTLLAVAGDNVAVLLLPVEGGDPITLLDKRSRILDVAFDARGTRLLTSHGDHVARVWDVASTSLLHQLRGHTGGVMRGALSHDGLFAVTGSHDRSVRTWDLTGSPSLLDRSVVVAEGSGAVLQVGFTCDQRGVFLTTAAGETEIVPRRTPEEIDALLEAVTNFCLPPGQAIGLLGGDWDARTAEYAACLAVQQGAGPAQPGEPDVSAAGQED